MWRRRARSSSATGREGGGNRWVVESGLKPGDAMIVDGVAR